MAHNTTAPWDKLSCTDFVKFGKFQNRIEDLSWSKKDSNYLDIQHEVFKRDDNKNIRLVQKLIVGEAYFN